MPFTNTQLDITSIPAIQEIEYTELNRSYLNISLIWSATFAILVIFVSFFTLLLLRVTGDEAYKVFLQSYLYHVMFAIVLLFAARLFTIYLGFFKKGYAVRENDICYKTGLFWKTKAMIPFNRIQHSEVKQGPIERLFELSSLHIYTAGGSSSDLTIPGLTTDEANRLKQFIINKTAKNGES